MIIVKKSIEIGGGQELSILAFGTWRNAAFVYYSRSLFELTLYVEYWTQRKEKYENGSDFMKTGRLGRGVLVFTANIQRCAGMSEQWRTWGDHKLQVTPLKNCSILGRSCIFLRNWKYYVQNNLEKRTKLRYPFKIMDTKSHTRPLSHKTGVLLI